MSTQITSRAIAIAKLEELRECLFIDVDLFDELYTIIRRLQGGRCPYFADRECVQSIPPTMRSAYVHEECNEWGPPYSPEQEANKCKLVIC